MGRQDVASQHNTVAGPGEAIPQLDVFNGRAGISVRVEPAVLEKEGAAHGTATRPEGVHSPNSRVESSLLVHEMVEQVAVSADDAASGWRIVVRTEERSQRRVAVEPGCSPSQGVGMDCDVGVEEEQERRLRGVGPEVARRQARSASDC